MKKSDYTVNDFVVNEYFQSWVLNPDEEAEQFWKAWMQDNPGHEKIMEEARDTVLLLEFTNDKTANKDLLDVWKRIRRSAQLPSSQTSKASPRPVYWKVAAVLLGLIVFTALIYLYNIQTGTVLYSSRYGEIKHFVLPDSSKVVLNGNSQLRLPRNSWQASGKREVFLEGEAFFEVKHVDNNGEALKFVVHTEELDVEVLGTAFNVSSRHKETAVILNSGKVRINIPQASDTTQLLMKPGDFVKYNKASDKASVQYVETPDLLSSWKDNLLIFNETPLIEISNVLKDTYGLEIIFPHDSLAQKRFRGTFLADDINILKEALTETYDIKIIESN